MAAPYRNDLDALMARLTALVDELASLRTRTSELRDLERSEHEIERELGEVRRKVARIAPSRLPLLERVAVAAPCPADWNSMKGDERTRFCDQCQKNVYNIASMGAEEAETFLRQAGGEACVRLYRRADGTVLTSDCSVGVRRRRRRRAVASVVGGGLVAAGALLAFDRPAVRGMAVFPTDSHPHMVMGGAPVFHDPTRPATTGAVATTTATATPVVPAGKPTAMTPETRLDAELAHVRSLLDKRAGTTDPAQRRAIEAEIRTASQKVVELSRPAKAGSRAGDQ